MAQRARQHKAMVRMIVNEAPHIMDVLDNYVHCFNGGPGDDGYLIGSHVYKDFPGHGGVGGHVVAYDKSAMWYLVTYTDGDREEMTADEVIEIETTETDSLNLWYHDSGQYGYSGKAHTGVIGSLYYIEIPETRYMAGTTGLFLYTGTGYAPWHVSIYDDGGYATLYRHEGELTTRKEFLHEVKKHTRRAHGDIVPRLKPM